MSPEQIEKHAIEWLGMSKPVLNSIEDVVKLMKHIQRDATTYDIFRRYNTNHSKEDQENSRIKHQLGSSFLLNCCKAYLEKNRHRIVIPSLPDGEREYFECLDKLITDDLNHMIKAMIDGEDDE